MKKIMLFLVVAIVFTQNKLHAQHKTENVVIVTLDGMRWQEVFKGVDAALLANKEFTRDSSFIAEKFTAPTPEASRAKLFPFLWSIVQQHGRLYGNRLYENDMNVANPYNFSYPGYNEIFTGYPDTAVNSNDKIKNKNENVLGFLNKQKGFTGKVAAFTTWDVFPYILNKWESGIYVNADTDTLHFNNAALSLINDMQFLTAQPLNVRPDIFTYTAAREYMKAYAPRVLYIAFDETDDFAHGGLYDQYLKSAHAEDAMIHDLWNYIQSNPKYKNKTTLIVTCDHGRGDVNKENWRSHGTRIPESSQIWMAVMGPDITPEGEVKKPMQIYQDQIAATIARLLGFTFTANHPVAKPIEQLFQK